RPVEPPQDRSGLQSVRPRAARRMRAGQAAREDAAQHEGRAVIALIDYGAGNLTSVKKALAACGAQVRVPREPGGRAHAPRIIVPGVGHFGATERLKGEWTDAILARVGEGRPLLGICLGMHWLYESSDEAPDVAGLGLFSGSCFKLPAHGVKIPHVGWNDLLI